MQIISLELFLLPWYLDLGFATYIVIDLGFATCIVIDLGLITIYSI
jgi:hypothetical protein